MKNIQDGLTPRVVQGCANLSQAARLSLLQFRLKLQKSRGRRSLAQKLDISRALSLNVFDGVPWLKIFQSWSHRLHRTSLFVGPWLPKFWAFGLPNVAVPFLDSTFRSLLLVFFPYRPQISKLGWCIRGRSTLGCLQNVDKPLKNVHSLTSSLGGHLTSSSQIDLKQ